MFMDVRAAELAEGSVVATSHSAFIRVKGYPKPWLSTGGVRFASHEMVDALLVQDAAVLRDGTGEEVEI
jgi:hypothetical protein